MASKKDNHVTGERVLARFKEFLKCRLTKEEIAERSMAVVELTKERERIELEAKSAAQTFKERIAAVDSKRRIAMDAASSGLEDREVEVVDMMDAFDVVERIRCDTGEVIKRREATAAERQEVLGL